MKKFLLVILACFFVTLLLSGCSDDDTTSSSTPPLAPATTITITPNKYDFGEVNAGETKTATFRMSTNGFVTSRAYASSDVLGLDISNLESTLENMAENLTTNSIFNISFKPVCQGAISGELYFNTDTFGGATIRIPLTVNVIDSSLPYCNKNNPVITLTTVPASAIKTGTIVDTNTGESLEEQKYVDFDTLIPKQLTITAKSDTIIQGGSSTKQTGIFSANVTSWNLNNNEVTANATITFDPTKCSGLTSDRIRINGLDETSASPYLYVIGTGTSGATCPNRYTIQNN